eukprot:gene1351-4477_t
MPPVPDDLKMTDLLRDLWPGFDIFSHAVHSRFNKMCAAGPDLLTNLHMSILPPDKLRVIYDGTRQIAEGIDDMPRDQLRNYIRLLFKASNPLMLEFWRALVVQSTQFKCTEFLFQVPLETHLEAWILRFLPGIICGFRKHFGARVAIDKGHARADLARMASRPTCFQDADVKRAFPSIDRPAVMLTMLAMGMSYRFVMAQSRLWGITDFDPNTGATVSSPELEPRGLLAIPGTSYPEVRWERGAMEGTRNGPSHWQVIACLIARFLVVDLAAKLWALLVVADDIKIEHSPLDAQV